MLFNSYQFAFGFLPIVVLLFWALSALNSRRATATLIILASLFFYAWWDWRFLLLFAFSILFNFCWSLMLTPPADISSQPREPGSRTLLGIGITVNLALLGYFKYRDFFLRIAGPAFGVHSHLAPLVLPLAISFFTFEQITYLTGAWRGEAGHGDFVSYLLFIAFFPHLIAGPIVRYPEIYPQLNRSSALRLTAVNLNEGLMIFVIGLAKKVLLADSFRLIVTPLFDNASKLALYDGWGAALAFGLEIYFDFSGYSDMAIGLARIFGVRFPENFDSPYKSRSVIEFWRRWHLTLSFFLRDYLYIPLGGNRHGELRRHLNLFITMLLGGLWHGANWTFVAWGALHGAFLSINHVWNKSGRRLPDAIAWALTFLMVTGAWVFFRAPTFARAKIILIAMAGLSGIEFTSSNYSIGWRQFAQIGVGLIIVFLCPNRQTIMSWRWDSDWLYALAFAALGGVSVMAMANPPPFIYFQF